MKILTRKRVIIYSNIYIYIIHTNKSNVLVSHNIYIYMCIYMYMCVYMYILPTYLPTYLAS